MCVKSRVTRTVPATRRLNGQTPANRRVQLTAPCNVVFRRTRPRNSGRNLAMQSRIQMHGAEHLKIPGG